MYARRSYRRASVPTQIGISGLKRLRDFSGDLEVLSEDGATALSGSFSGLGFSPLDCHSERISGSVLGLYADSVDLKICNPKAAGLNGFQWRIYEPVDFSHSIRIQNCEFRNLDLKIPGHPLSHCFLDHSTLNPQ